MEFDLQPSVVSRFEIWGRIIDRIESSHTSVCSKMVNTGLTTVV